MADICCGVVNEGSQSTSGSPCESSLSRAARRRRLQIRRFKVSAASDEEGEQNKQKRRRVDQEAELPSCSGDGADENRFTISELQETNLSHSIPRMLLSGSPITTPPQKADPKFGVVSVRGGRREMEDAVAIHPRFCPEQHENKAVGSHYFGVYDGHGCSHVALKCRDRLHDLVKEELENGGKLSEAEWTVAMGRSFSRMDSEVTGWKHDLSSVLARCRCDLQTPECDAVGSTAVVSVVTPDKIIVANCGDSRAVLCRNGKAVPLSSDHKPDRPDELKRIQDAGGRVIYWDGARVFGVLAMSRAIGDSYLKPYVCCNPEVMIADRTGEDECLILASDGLWDVVTNEVACKVARMCLCGNAPAAAGSLLSSPVNDAGGCDSDKACSDAATLLAKLALARRSSDNISVVVIDLRRDT